MHPKLIKKRQLEAANAMVEGLAKMEETLAILVAKVDGFERKLVALGRLTKAKGK